MINFPGDRVEARTRYSGEFWDADRIMGCLCDDGWMGYDCSLQTCPFGDDPSSYGQQHESQVVRCLTGGQGTTQYASHVGGQGVGSEGKGEATSDVAGTFTLRFCRFGSDVAPTTPLPHNVTAAMVEEALEALSSLGDVEVELFNVDLSSATSTDDVNHGVNDDNNAVASSKGVPVCAPRAAQDTLLVLPTSLPAPGYLFAGSTDGGDGGDDGKGFVDDDEASGVKAAAVSGGSGATLSLALTAHPAEELTVTLTPRRAVDGSVAASSELRVWPANFTVSPARRGVSVGGAPPVQSFRVLAGADGANGVSRLGLSLGGSLYYVEASLSTASSNNNGGNRFFAFAEGPAAAVAYSPVRVINGGSHLATPNLSARNATLLPGATNPMFTLGFSTKASVLTGDDDDGNDVSGGGSTLVVVPGASNSKSGVDLVAAGVVTFNPFTLTLTKDSPSANFTISASAGALSAPAKESVLVTSVLSGNLAATFTSLSAQDEILGERVEVLHRSSSSSSGAVEAEAALGFVLALAATAVMMPPPVLPSL